MQKNFKIERDQNFGNKNGNLKRLPSDFYYDVFLFQIYQYRKTQGKYYIYTKIDYENRLENFSMQQKSTKPIMLLKLLTLRERLSNELFCTPSKIICCDDFINEKDINMIMNLCKTYGYPFANDIYSINHKPAKLLSNSLKTPRNIQFSVSDFIYHLNEIYSAYQLFRVISGFTDKITYPIFIKGLNEEQIGIKSFVDLRKLNKNECKELFEQKYKNIKFENRISFEIEPHFIVKTQNLFEAAFYQLVLLMYNHERELRICPLCFEYFKPEHGHQKYCGRYIDSESFSGCYPQKAYKRRKALEKKSSQPNKD